MSACRAIILSQTLRILIVFFPIQVFMVATMKAQDNTIEIFTDQKLQVIDGFGAHQGDADVNQSWWKELYFNDLRASIYRVDLTPKLMSPFSDSTYYSPWFLGSGVSSKFNLEDASYPNGPEGNRVRTYTGPEDYSRLFGDAHAPIAVMGPDIDQNVNYFTYTDEAAIDEGIQQKSDLGDFKLIGSFWSPLPWVKITSGNSWNQDWFPGPTQGTAWPFIWGGNFAGGRIDVSSNPLEVFDDSALGGSGPTSSLTQLARSTAAYIRGYQDFHHLRFYAISIQNELNFEEYYSSAFYPLSSQYILALKAIRAEFDKYDDLKDIRIMGPEDLMGGDAYGMWQYGGGDGIIHKNLQYLQNISADDEANDALSFFCIHGYASDGVSASGAAANLWSWWANGWTTSPAGGIPSNIAGFKSFGKKSWMTETSGEDPAWLSPSTGYPGNGAWSIALKIQQALTTGMESAWLYWTFTVNDDDGNVSPYGLTNETSAETAPKYIAAKHFYRYIRPGTYRIKSSGSASLLASAYKNDDSGKITIVVINTSPGALTTKIEIPSLSSSGNLQFDGYTSQNGNYWQPSVIALTDGETSLQVPGYGVVTLNGGTDLVTGMVMPPKERDALFQNLPNPSHDQTAIRYRLSYRELVSIVLTDLHGKPVTQLVNAVQDPGIHELTMNTGTLSNGLYLYTMQTQQFICTKKLLVSK